MKVWDSPKIEKSFYLWTHYMAF